MKEKERLDNLVESLDDDDIKHVTFVYDHRVWHAVLKYPDGVYCRGFSFLADLDAKLPEATTAVRGRLIAIGRAIKSNHVNASGELVKRPSTQALVMQYSLPCPITQAFFKSQCNVVPTSAEKLALARVANDVDVPPPPPADSVLCDLVQRLVDNSGGNGVSRAEVIRAYFLQYRHSDDSFLALKQLVDLDWYKAHGFGVATRHVIV